MRYAFVFPGQGAQFTGMGKDLYDSNEIAKALFERANKILEFRISDVMFEGSAEELAQTQVTQPAIFLHSVAAFEALADKTPDMVAGHSLGEFSALVASGALAFEDALKLVKVRATAMQNACEQNPSTMAAVLGLEDRIVEEVCASLEEVVVPANYNSPGQVVISGTNEGVEHASRLLKEAGAKRIVPLQVGGAFHSPLMQSAKVELETAITRTHFKKSRCAVFQNVTAMPETEPEVIQLNLIRQLTSPVRWTQSVQNMISHGASHFIECGPGNVLQGLVRKINREVEVSGVG